MNRDILCERDFRDACRNGPPLSAKVATYEQKLERALLWLNALYSTRKHKVRINANELF
jgi:hypothetical protein